MRASKWQPKKKPDYIISEYLECLLVILVAIWHKINPSIWTQTHLLWAFSRSMETWLVFEQLRLRTDLRTLPHTAQQGCSRESWKGKVGKRGKGFQETWTAFCYIKRCDLLYFIAQEQDMWTHNAWRLQKHSFRYAGMSKSVEPERTVVWERL